MDEGGNPQLDGGVKHRGVSFVPLDGGAQVKSATDNVGTFDPTNPDVRLHAGGAASPSYPRRIFVAGRRLVAEDYGRGERTPGALAASRELDMTRATPISQYGTVRKMSLPLSEILHLHRALTGEASPARLVKNAKGGALEGATRTLADRVAMNADILGVVDKTDLVPLKDRLRQNGFFRNEDPTWQATHSPIGDKRLELIDALAVTHLARFWYAVNREEDEDNRALPVLSSDEQTGASGILSG